MRAIKHGGQYMVDGSAATADAGLRPRLIPRDILRCGLAAATAAVTAPASGGWPERLRAARDGVTIRHLLTHCSGLPDQLENNAALRRSHAPLAEFVRHACRAPLAFAPGSCYAYSSMGILLAVAIVSRIDGREITRLVQEEVLDRLADLVPPPREHRHRYHGVFAPTHKLRPAVTAPEQWQALREAPEHVTAVKVGPTRPELHQAGDQTRSRRTGG